MQQPSRIEMQIGEYQIIPIPTGIFGLDGGAMFGTVPKVIWEKTNPPDDKNRIPMEARALLLKGRSRNVLIDTGNGGDFVAKYGEKLGNKFCELYNVTDTGENGLLKTLQRYGVSTNDISDVILTHLHFDHAGGGTHAQEGQIVPTFPSATYYVQKTNLETAKHPNVRERASYLSPNFEPLLTAGKLKILEGDIESLLPGISVFVSNGHTIGQQLVQVFDSKNTLVYCGDLIPTSSHVRLPFVMGYDLYPLTIIEEKNELLKKAAAGKWYLYFEHDPYSDAAQVEASGSDFKLTSTYQLSVTS